MQPPAPAVLPLPADVIDAIGLIAVRRKVRISNIEQLKSDCHGGVELEWLVGQLSAAKVHARVAGLTRNLSAALQGQELPVLLLLANGGYVIAEGAEWNDGGELISIAIAGFDRERGDFVRAAAKPEEILSAWSGYLLSIEADPVTLGLKDSRPFGLWWFVRIVTRERETLPLVASSIVTVHALGLVLPLIFAAVVDRVLPSEQRGTLAALAILGVLVIVSDGVLRYLRDVMIAFISARLDATSAAETFGHLLSLPIDYFQKSSTGVVTRNLRQYQEVREFLAGPCTQTSIQVFGLPFALGLLYYFSPILTLVVLVGGLLMALVIYAAWAPFGRTLEEAMFTEGIMQGRLVESVHGALTVKSLGLENQIETEWQSLAGAAARQHYDLRRIVASCLTLVTVIENAVTISILVFGVSLVLDGTMSVGSLVAFKLIANQVTDPLKSVANLAQEYRKTGKSIELLGQIMDVPADVSNGGRVAALTGQIALKTLEFSYSKGNTPALTDVSLMVEPGAFIGVVGPSGSGKSTLTKLLLGLIQPSNGSVEYAAFDGGNTTWQTTRELNMANLRRNQIAVVLQENQLFQGTIAENIRFGKPDATFEDIVRAAQQAGAHEFIMESADGAGYERILEEGASNLSGGQRQRLAIARALVRQPRVLILDEATSALDVDSERVVKQSLDAYRRASSPPCTIIAIAHRLSTIRDADQIIVFDRGQIIGKGRHGELIDSNSTKFSKKYIEMWKKQSPETAETTRLPVPA